MRSNLKTLIESPENGITIERLPTNTTTKNHAVHRWFNFIAGFSPEFVNACIATTGVPPSQLKLLDPFSGCGTAPLAARFVGASAIGYDPHPFFAVISEAKVNSSLYWKTLPAIRLAIERGISRPTLSPLSLSDAAQTFLNKMFKPEDLAALHAAKNELTISGLSENPLAILILSRILDHCCFAATDGIYKAPTSTKKTISPVDAVNRVFSVIESDQLEASTQRKACYIYNKSSEKMDDVESGSVDVIVTSPPYLNNFDFAEMTRMYLYFWQMASSWSEITDRVRSRLIVNTTTALKGHKPLQQTYRKTLPDCVRTAADSIVDKLATIRVEAGKSKEYDQLIYPYLSQMQKTLIESHRVLRSGAPFHMMVSDAALYGTHIPAPQWLADIMIEIGFTNVQCEMVRPRGHRWVLDKRLGAKEGLGEYYIYGNAG